LPIISPCSVAAPWISPVIWLSQSPLSKVQDLDDDHAVYYCVQEVEINLEQDK
jgi:hypothetical protein